MTMPEAIASAANHVATAAVAVTLIICAYKTLHKLLK
jgi:hypothetical protein